MEVVNISYGFYFIFFMFVILYERYVTFTSKLNSLKQQTFMCSEFLWVRNSEVASLGGSGSRTLKML